MCVRVCVWVGSHTYRHTHTDRQTDRHTHTHSNTHTQSNTYTHTYRHKHTHTDTHTLKHTDTHMNKENKRRECVLVSFSKCACDWMNLRVCVIGRERERERGRLRQTEIKKFYDNRFTFCHTQRRRHNLVKSPNKPIRSKNSIQKLFAFEILKNSRHYFYIPI